MTQIFALLLAIFKAVPILQGWYEQFMVWYVEQQKAQLKKEIRDAIRKSLASGDQRPIEEVLQSNVAGSPVAGDGSVIVDTLPGVPQ